MKEEAKYIQPKSMAYLHQKILGKHIGFLLLSNFLWLHAALQEEMGVYTAVVMAIAFFIMARFHSRVLAVLLLLSLLGIFYFPKTSHYVALWFFSGLLFISTVLIVGGKRREIPLLSKGIF